MTLFHDYDKLAVINFMIHMAIFGVAVCRSGNLQQKKSLFRVRVQYIMLTPVSLGCALSPVLFQSWPSGMAVIFAGVILAMLLLDSWQWKRGAPRMTDTDFNHLEEIKDDQAKADA